MIQQKEVKLGNLLQCGEEIVIVSAIYRSGFHCVNESGVDRDSNIYSLKPIPLTKEWLFSMGFIKSDKYSYHNNSGHTLSLTPNDLQWNIYYNNHLLFTRYLSVHELQNLTSELLKVELTLKEPE